jgi:hypothetical protein
MALPLDPEKSGQNRMSKLSSLLGFSLVNGVKYKQSLLDSDDDRAVNFPPTVREELFFSRRSLSFLQFPRNLSFAGKWSRHGAKQCARNRFFHIVPCRSSNFRVTSVLRERGAATEQNSAR